MKDSILSYANFCTSSDTIRRGNKPLALELTRGHIECMHFVRRIKAFINRQGSCICIQQTTYSLFSAIASTAIPPRDADCSPCRTSARHFSRPKRWFICTTVMISDASAVEILATQCLTKRQSGKHEDHPRVHDFVSTTELNMLVSTLGIR